MNKVCQKASLHERAVQKVAKENITLAKKTRGRASRKPSTAVSKSHWSDGVDPRIIKAVAKMRIPRVWRCIEVISPTEIVIHNKPL